MVSTAHFWKEEGSSALTYTVYLPCCVRWQQYHGTALSLPVTHDSLYFRIHATDSCSTSPVHSFADHKVFVGQFVAVYFEEGRFFGKVTRLLRPGPGGKLMAWQADISLQDRPANVKVCCAWLTEVERQDRHPIDMRNSVSSFVLSTSDLYYCKSCRMMHV